MIYSNATLRFAPRRIAAPRFASLRSSTQRHSRAAERRRGGMVRNYAYHF
jgi:hypothetical protein